MSAHLRRVKRVNEATQHDIKLELDVRCQALITRRLAAAVPGVPVLGEEKLDPRSESAPWRWVVDPIDGTVNFAYGIPHACVCIALQRARNGNGGRDGAGAGETHETMVGVVYDPFLDETWTAVRGRGARLNGRLISVSPHRRLGEAVISLGFSKSRETLDAMLPAVGKLAHRVRKLRVMGSAGLALTYVACGRFDAYVEPGVRLWDIAAGGLMVECAGGEFWRRPVPGGTHLYQLNANNGRLRRAIETAIQS